MSSKQWDCLLNESSSFQTPLPSESNFILGAGRLAKVKGFDRLIRAFHGVHLPELRLVILGEGRERPHLERLASELEMADKVNLPGWATDIDPWYQAAKCFVLSSHAESFGNVILEAMANYCPVVAFDCPYGPGEIIRNEHNGLLVPHADINGLTAAILRVIESPVLRDTLVANGLATAREHRIEKLAGRWLEGI